MTKDYASRQKAKLHARPREVYARSASTQPSNFSITPWVWICTGVLLGFLLAAGLYWRHGTLSQPQATAAPVKEKRNAATKKNSSHTSADSGSSRFDFYTVLPAMTLEIPSEDADPHWTATVNAAAKNKTDLAPAQEPIVAPAKIAPTSYIIQVGSFRHLAQAEELKAKLAFSGLEASIQTTKLDNRESRYRVSVGPFSSKEAALSSQQQIQKAHQLNGLIVKINV